VSFGRQLGVFRSHLIADRLFSKTVPENGFEDSFKHDPVLIALQHGRIWNPHSADDQSAHVSRMAVQSHMTTKPIVFWLLITKSQVPEDISGRYTSEQDLYRDRKVVHKYTGLNPQPRSREYLDNIPNWRERFPPLAQAISINELSTEIIHMDVSLELMRDYAPGGAELFTRMEMTIPGHGLQGHQWQTVTSLFKPQELYYADLRHDPPLDGKKFIVDALEVNDVGARIKVPFPPNAWAHALTRLTDIQHAQAESRKSQILEGGTHSTSAREYIEQISMYQEVQSAAHCSSCAQRQINRGYNSASRCSCGKGAFLTRAIILWTFHKARHGEQGSTTWRYVDAFPPRRMVMSPSPHPTHHVQASMSEHFNSWAETPMQLHQQNMLDPFSQVQGLVTPPATAGLQSPFASGFVYQNQNAFDLHQENVSFISHGTVDSESTLVEENTVASIDSFLSNSNVNLGDLDNHANGWHMPHSESFDAQPSWAYNVPTTMPQLGWENEKVHAWPEVTPARQASWSEASPTKPSHVWPGSTPTKQVGWNSEGSLTKLASWSEDVSEKHEQQPEQLWDVLPTQIATKQDQRFVTEEAERKAYTWMAQPTVVDGDGDRESKNEIHNFVEVTGQEEKIGPLPELGSGNASGTGAKAWSTCDEAFVMVRNDEAFGYNGHE
jgi:transcriptional enhancer factor